MWKFWLVGLDRNSSSPILYWFFVSLVKNCWPSTWHKLNSPTKSNTPSKTPKSSVLALYSGSQREYPQNNGVDSTAPPLPSPADTAKTPPSTLLRRLHHSPVTQLPSPTQTDSPDLPTPTPPPISPLHYHVLQRRPCHRAPNLCRGLLPPILQRPPVRQIPPDAIPSSRAGPGAHPPYPLPLQIHPIRLLRGLLRPLLGRRPKP